jgi:hypothetical protein
LLSVLRRAAFTHAPSGMAAQSHGAWAVQSAAEVRARDAPPPRVRIACFPSAGSGACLFHGWGAVLPEWAEVLPVELPGRNTRIRERMPVRARPCSLC